MFELHYEPLIISKELKPWEIAVIPWDTESFGFKVSVLKPSNYGNKNYPATLVEEALRDYSRDKQVQVIIASIPSGQKETSLLLQQSRFRFIDLALGIEYKNLKDISVKYPDGLSLNPATSTEVTGLVELAGNSFEYGRYNMDTYFSKSQSDQRYKDWLSRCLNPDSRQQILAIKFDGKVCGFSVIEYTSEFGYMHLHAIDSKWRGKKLGIGSFLQSLWYLDSLGAETIGTKISISNLNALNMNSRLNGRFTTSDQLLHWHSQEKY